MNVPSADAPASEWLVYADALQQKGDPLGEFIVLVNSGDAAKREAWLQKNARALLGDTLGAQLSETLTLDWKWGFIAKATVKSSQPTTVGLVVDALLAHRLSERLETLVLRGVPGDDDAPVDLTDVVSKLGARTLPPQLELIDHRADGVTLLTSRDFDPGNNLVNFGPLTALWKSARALKLVVADVRQVTLGAINAPSLESLTIHGLRLAGQNYGDIEPCEACDALGQAKLPKLKHFDMRLVEEWTVNHVDDTDSYTTHDSFPEDEFDTGYSEGANWPNEFGAALRNLVKSPLERLALTNFASTTSLLELLAATGLPPTLRVLDLSQSSLSSSDVAWFTANKALLSKLEKLVVLETGFTDDDVKTLKTVVREVEHSRAEPPARYDDGNEEEGAAPAGAPLPKYRYTVGME